MSLTYWLAANHLQNIYPRTFMRWLSHFASITDLFHASSEALLKAGANTEQITAIKQFDWKAVEKDLAWSEKENHHLITITDEFYPPLLKEMADPPLVLYIQGNRLALAQIQIAIVGSREATIIGLKNAESFAFLLAEAGFAITSGLALGIDTASHKGALAANGLTIGVAGTGLQHIYPKGNKSLIERIVSHQGAIISEFPLYIGPRAFNFPRRNRIISGLSIGVLVVEAALKSGSLITARYALEQGREVFAIPGSIHQSRSQGCHHLIRQGAVLVESVQDIIAELGALQALMRSIAPPSSQRVKEGAALLDPNQCCILNLIEYEITPMNVILLRSGLTAGEVSSILLTLELKGYIQSVTGGYVRTRSN